MIAKAKEIIKEEMIKARIEYKSVKINLSLSKRVGVQGDQRTYKPFIEITIPKKQRRIFYEKCAEKTSNRMTNEINEINGVIYTIL